MTIAVPLRDRARGYIWVIDAGTHNVGAPFGGFKQSGIGHEESIDELLACTRLKNVSVVLGGTGGGTGAHP